MNYTLFQKSPSNKYLKAHVLFISIGVIELANLHKYITKSSNILNNLLEKTKEIIVVFSKDNHRNFLIGTVPPQYYNEYDSSVHIIGGLFGGKKENMKWFVDEFDKMLNLITNEQKKIYSEEQIMSLIYQNNKNKFKTFDFDVWWHETNGPKGLPEDFFVVNKSFYKSLEDVNI